ncbi:MAG: DsbE family thiol:disulfide interchange protein [Hyphomicrobium sp.]
MSERPTLLRLLPVAIFGVVAGFFALALTSGDPAKLPSALIGKPAPKSEFTPIEGLTAAGQPAPGFSTDELAKGRVSVVNFWASWCGPCVDEHPLIGELKTLAGVDVYGVNYKDDPASARRFLGRYGNPFTVVGADASGRTAIDWGVYGMPETFVIGPKGEIAYKHVGPMTPDSIRTRLLPAIEKAKAPSP